MIYECKLPFNESKFGWEKSVDVRYLSKWEIVEKTKEKITLQSITDFHVTSVPIDKFDIHFRKKE